MFGLAVDQRMISVALLALGITVGLLSPKFAYACQPFALHALFLVVVLSLLPFTRAPATYLFDIERGTLRIVGWQMVVVPALVVSAGTLARLPENVVMLLVVTACGGSLFASPALAQILGLERKQALQCMLLSTLAMPISLYAFLSALKGSQVVDLNLTDYSKRTLVFLVLPLVIFAAYRMIVGRIPASVSDRVDDGARWGTLFALIVFGVGMMHPVAAQLKANPQQVIFYFCLAVLVSLFMFSATSVVLWRYGRSEAMTGAVLGAFRNVGLGFALVGDMTGPELDVYVGVSMLPIFMGPMVMQLALTERSPEAKTANGAGSAPPSPAAA